MTERDAHHRALLARHRAGDSTALPALVADVTGLVRWLARRYWSPHHTDEDLVGEAWVGFMRAVHKFDPAAGMSFSSFATVQMRGALSHAVSGEHKNRGTRRAFWNAGKAAAALRQRGLDDSPSAVAAELGVPLASVESVLRRDVPLGATRELACPPDFADEVEANEAAARLREALDRLAPREREAVVRTLMVEEPETLGEVGARWGTSRQRVKQIRDRALDKLREEMRG